jgi:predicted permease
MDDLLQDLKHGARLLFKAPAFTSIAVLSLALGVGANTAIFSVADALLLRPLPYADDDRLTIIWQRSPGLDVKQDWLSIGQYLDIRHEGDVFENASAAIGTSFNVTGDGAPERVDGIRASSSIFVLAGARPFLGRLFTSAEDEPGQKPVAILSHDYWARRFGADSNIVGRTILLNGNPVTIVGVLPRELRFNRETMPTVNGIRHADVVLPLPVQPSARSNRGGEDYVVWGKLRRGVSLERAQASLDRIAARMKERYPAVYPPNGGLTLSAVPLIDQVVGDVRLALRILVGAVAFVLLIACGNVANLLLSRSAVRERELAIRSAVGAHRRRLLQQLVTENLLLAVVGSALGLALAYAGVAAITQFGPANIPRMDDVRIDGRVLTFVAGVAVLTGILFGLWPAIRASVIDPASALKEGARGASVAHGRLRRILVTTELALAVVLLVGAGLLLRSYERVLDADPGFRADHLLSLRTTLPGSKYNKPELIDNFYRALESRVRAIPGVQHVGFNYQLPFSALALAWEPINVEGYVPPAGSTDLVISSSAYVNADYFASMGIRLMEGRVFGPSDGGNATPVVIVDEQLARRFWHRESAVGKRIRQGSDGPWRTIVGVVHDSREYEGDAEPPITSFFPLSQFTLPSRYMVVRTSGDPAMLVRPITQVISELDPDLPAYDVSTMESRLHDSFARRRLSMTLLVTFAAIALLLAAIGIYGVISYWVGQRTRDIGIRVALGAESGSILRIVFQEFAMMIGLGIGGGLAIAAALSRVVQSMIFGITAHDAVTFIGIGVLLLIVSALAIWIPARRALAVSPVLALRGE